MRISLLSLTGRLHAAIVSIPTRIADPLKDNVREKISRYVNLYVSIRNKLGFRDTCLTYSILLCHMLRKHGLDAKINFGARKQATDPAGDIRSIGHCWVTVGQEELPMPYQIIFKHP